MLATRAQFPRTIAALLFTFVVARSAAAQTPFEQWWSERIPEPDGMTEERFAGQDPRYLQLLRTLAGATVAVATATAEVETGSRTATAMTRDAYQEFQAQPRGDREWGPRFEPTGDPDRPYLAVYEHTWHARRTVAAPDALNLVMTVEFPGLSGTGEMVYQRAWGGAQTWGTGGMTANDRGAILLPAWVPGSALMLDMLWSDAELLARALATVLAAGPPDAVTVDRAERGPRVAMRWRRSGAGELWIATHPRKDFAPLEWREVSVQDPLAQMREVLEKLRADGLEDIVSEVEMPNIDEMLGGFSNMPTVTERAEVRFEDWARGPGGAWVPRRVVRAVTSVPAEAPSQSETATEPEESLPADEQWVAWSHVRGGVPPAAAFSPPPGFEAYTAQEWIDIVLPAAPADRDRLIAGLRDGVQFTLGADPLGAPRWMVEDTDPLLLGEWPLLPRDVILEVSANQAWQGTATALNPETAPTPERLVERLADVIAKARYGQPTVLRVARGTTLIDVVCWAPKSDAAQDRLGLQRRIVRSHTYPALPSDKSVAFAQAVLAATEDLMRGAAH